MYDFIGWLQDNIILDHFKEKKNQKFIPTLNGEVIQRIYFRDQTNCCIAISPQNSININGLQVQN